jgi:hypothetical protein
MARAYDYLNQPFPFTDIELQQYDRRARNAYQVLMDARRFLNLSAEDNVRIQALTQLLRVIYSQRPLPYEEHLNLY